MALPVPIRTPPFLHAVPFTTVYLDAVLKSPQRSVVADAGAGALDVDAGASKSNRISKAKKRKKTKTLKKK